MIKLKTFIDLFAGIGGFHVALAMRGLKCVFASEIDAHAADSYEANFGLRPHGDITQINACDIPAHDVLCAGFPCQPFSNSGNGKGLADVRGGLFREIARIAKACQPKVLLLENVHHVLNMDRGDVLNAIIDALDDAGYRVNWFVMNSGAYGVPQARIRVFFVCIRKDLPLTFTPPKPLPPSAFKCVNDILLDDIEIADLIIDRDDIVFDTHISDEPTYLLKRIGYIGKDRQGEKIYSLNGQAPAQSVSCGRPTGMFYIPHNAITEKCLPDKKNGLVRTLHIKEALQVMGFDKNHIVSEEREGFRQTGNAVVPACVGAVFDGIKNG